MEYIRSMDSSADTGGCFFCRYFAAPPDDAIHHVFLRSPTIIAMLNRFPYTNGHLLIAPRAHVNDLAALSHEELSSLMGATRDCVRLLKEVLKPQGFNIGMNLERCAGAGVPDHLHMHVVPRWNGDTNYLAVVGDVRVIPQSLDALGSELAACAKRLRIP